MRWQEHTNESAPDSVKSWDALGAAPPPEPLDFKLAFDVPNFILEHPITRTHGISNLQLSVVQIVTKVPQRNLRQKSQDFAHWTPELCMAIQR
jgi:hypothetical protein